MEYSTRNLAESKKRQAPPSPVDTSEITQDLDELHPISFRLAFGLTHEEAAAALCIEPQTMRAYVKNRPSKRVKRLAAEIAKQWLNDNNREVRIDYLFDRS